VPVVQKVEVRWGQYKREKKEDQIDERTGRPRRVWKRYQRSGVVTLKLDKATVKPTSVHDEFPNVYVRSHVNSYSPPAALLKNTAMMDCTTSLGLTRLCTS
jgi:hypothetical protein